MLLSTVRSSTTRLAVRAAPRMTQVAPRALSSFTNTLSKKVGCLKFEKRKEGDSAQDLIIFILLLQSFEAYQVSLYHFFFYSNRRNMLKKRDTCASKKGNFLKRKRLKWYVEYQTMYD